MNNLKEKLKQVLSGADSINESRNSQSSPSGSITNKRSFIFTNK